MNSGMKSETQRVERRLGTWVVSAAMLFLLVLVAPEGSYGQRQHQAPKPPAARPAPARSAPAPQKKASVPAQRNGTDSGQPGQRGSYAPPSGNYPLAGANGFRSSPDTVVRPPGGLGPFRPGQEHLPQWLNQHQNLSTAQQENMLRREPGFNRLSPDQQQRVVNRLRNLDARPPIERQRILARNEAFEQLSPQQRQDVRTSAQSLSQMAPDRQRLVRRAFADLRRIPPNQRQQILNSARFSHDFSPQERHVLGSLLSIEPYQPGTN